MPLAPLSLQHSHLNPHPSVTLIPVVTVQRAVLIGMSVCDLMTSRSIKRAEGELINSSDLMGNRHSARLAVEVKGQAKSQMGHLPVCGFGCKTERTIYVHALPPVSIM